MKWWNLDVELHRVTIQRWVCCWILLELHFLINVEFQQQFWVKLLLVVVVFFRQLWDLNYWIRLSDLLFLSIVSWVKSKDIVFVSLLIFVNHVIWWYYKGLTLIDDKLKLLISFDQDLCFPSTICKSESLSSYPLAWNFMRPGTTCFWSELSKYLNTLSTLVSF